MEVLAEAGGLVKPREVVKLAAEEGFSRRVVYRVRKGLEGTVVDTAGKHARHSEWNLVG